MAFFFNDVTQLTSFAEAGYLTDAGILNIGEDWLEHTHWDVWVVKLWIPQSHASRLESIFVRWYSAITICFSRSYYFSDSKFLFKLNAGIFW